MKLSNFESFVNENDDSRSPLARKIFGDSEDLSTLIIDEIVIDITLDQWGGFEIGDGEFFYPINKLISVKPEFFIKVEKDGEKYKTYTIPFPFQPKEDTSNWDEDDIQMYTMASVFIVTKEDIVKYLQKNSKFGIYNVVRENGIVTIDDMMWHYLGIGQCTGEFWLKPEECEKYPELMDEYKKYFSGDISKIIKYCEK